MQTANKRLPELPVVPPEKPTQALQLGKTTETPPRPRETGLLLRCAGKAGNPFQTTQGNRLSCRDQEGRRGSDQAMQEKKALSSHFLILTEQSEPLN